jgi:hypothetical protein
LDKPVTTCSDVQIESHLSNAPGIAPKSSNKCINSMCDCLISNKNLVKYVAGGGCKMAKAGNKGTQALK